MESHKSQVRSVGMTRNLSLHIELTALIKMKTLVLVQDGRLLHSRLVGCSWYWW